MTSRWFGEQRQAAIDDFWWVYTEHLELNLVALRALEARGGALGETVEARALDARDALGAAMDGDWAPFESYLRAVASRYARTGLDLSAWHEVGQVFFAALVPALIEALASDAARLAAALGVLADFVLHALSVVADAYSETRAQTAERHRRVIEASLDPVIALDADGVVTAFNAAAERTFAIPREVAVGRALATLVLPAATRDQFARYLATGADQRIETVAIRSDGSGLPVELAIAAHPSPDGRREITVFVRDLTTQKVAEASITMWRQFLDQAHIGVAVSEVGTRKIVQVNRAYADLLGYAVDELRDFPGDRLIAARTDLSALARTLQARTNSTFELELRRKDGTTVPVLASSSVLTGGTGVELRISTVIDYTEHRALELARARVARHVELVSLAAERFTAATGDLALLQRLVAGNVEELVRCRCTVEVFEAGKRAARASGLLGADPRALVVALRSRGVPVGILRCERAPDAPAFTDEEHKLVRDLADRAALAIENAILVANLEARVVERTDALRMTVQQLEATNRELARAAAQLEVASVRKSDFLASLSHELRTPLNAIIGFSELMFDGVIPPGAPEGKEFLGDVLASGRHLLELVNAILDLAKVEAGKLEFLPAACRVSELVDEVVGVLRSAIVRRHLEVETAIDGAHDAVFLDPARLKQVLYNYLSNAIKFTPEGGRIVVRTRAGDDAQRFRLEVEDTGPGLTADEIDRLFVEYEQTATGRFGVGTGLGLALTKRLVEAQRGAVGVRSTPGAGSVFWADLPRGA